MRYIGQLLGYVILIFNAVVAALLLFVAYSPDIDPQAHPVLSCAGLFFPFFWVANLAFLVFWLVVYRRYALFPLLVLLICWGSIRTYFPVNWSGGDTRAFGDMKAHTKETPNEVLTYLQKSDADIICLQEYVWGGKLKKKDIDYALRDYSYRHYYSLADGWNGLGCYSRYPILSAKPIPYKSASNGSIAYYIKVKDDTLVVVNNHLESNRILDEDVKTYQTMVNTPNRENVSFGLRTLLKKLAEASKVRAKQTDVVKETLRGLDENASVIVCGDFNDTPISYTHHTLSENLQDAFVEAGNGLGISYNRHRLYFRIDHILCSKNMDVHRCEVDNTIEASDHYPVWCYLSLKKDND